LSGFLSEFHLLFRREIVLARSDFYPSVAVRGSKEQNPEQQRQPGNRNIANQACSRASLRGHICNALSQKLSF
jgi:hypothetical protein